MAELTPSERVLRARLAAHALHAQRDSRETTAKARQVFMDRFDREVDPDGSLPARERAQRAAHAKKAYFTRLALASARSRRSSARTGGVEKAGSGDATEVVVTDQR